MDITETLAPKSDQLNADDLLGGPITVTITAVSRGDADQPVNITTAEFGEGRPYKPCKSMRRVMVAAWGIDASTYVGHRMTIFNDQSVKWGGQDVGGIRIKALSHIQKRLTLALTVTRGKRAPFVVEPLPDAPPAQQPITPETVAEFERDIAAATTVDELDVVAADLKAWDLGSHRKHLQSAWGDRRAAIKSEAAPESEQGTQEELA